MKQLSAWKDWEKPIPPDRCIERPEDWVSQNSVGRVFYLGIDPGHSGGIAVIGGSGYVATSKMLPTSHDTWEWLKSFLHPETIDYRCMIEQQVPRPTRYFDKVRKTWSQSILKSTCLLYGSYCKMLGMLIAAGVPFEEVSPQTWQKGLGLRKRIKGESDPDWKNHLKGKAQALFPKERVTLYTSDALLLAHYCRLKNHGQSRQVHGLGSDFDEVSGEVHLLS